MNIRPEILQIANVQIDVVRKNIKNMHLAVYPPHGRIRLAVPENTDEEILRLFAISKTRLDKKNMSKTLKSKPEKQSVIMYQAKAISFKAKGIFLKSMKTKATVK